MNGEAVYCDDWLFPHLFEMLVQTAVPPCMESRQVQLAVSRLSLPHVRGHLRESEPFSTSSCHAAGRHLSPGAAHESYWEFPFTMNGRRNFAVFLFSHESGRKIAATQRISSSKALRSPIRYVQGHIPSGLLCNVNAIFLLVTS